MVQKQKWIFFLIFFILGGCAALMGPAGEMGDGVPSSGVQGPYLVVQSGGTAIQSGGTVSVTAVQGISSTATFNLNSSGTEAVTLTGSPSAVALTGGPAELTITQQPGSTVLNPGATASFQLGYTFSTAGVYQATVNVPSSDPGKTAFSFIFKINVVTAAAQIKVLHGASVCANSVTCFDFGSQDYLSSTQESFTLVNDGNIDLVLTSYSSDMVLFSLDMTFPVTLTPQQSISFSVKYEPGTQTEGGVGQIEFASNAVNSFLLQVAGQTKWKFVTASGTSPSISYTSPSLIDVNALALVFDAGGNPFVAYSRSTSPNTSAVKTLTAGGWSGLDGAAGEIDSSYAQDVDLALIGGSFYVAYRDSSSYVRIKKWTGSAWDETGLSITPPVISLPGQKIQIRGTSSSSIFVAYLDSGNNLQVYRYDGSSWTAQGFSPNTAVPSFSMELDGSGNLYLAYRSATANCLLPYSGSGFTTCNSFSATDTDAISIRLVMDGTTPYVAYLTGSTTLKLTRFLSGSWESLPNLPVAAQNLSLAVSGGVSYAAFHASTDQNIRIMKLSGGVWSGLGVADGTALGFTGAMMFFELKFYGGLPYLLYKALDNSGMAHLIKYVP